MASNSIKKFETNFQRVDFDFSKVVYLYSVEIERLDLQTELKQRSIKVALIDSFAEQNGIKHFLYDGDKKFFVPDQLPASSDEVDIQHGGRNESYRLRFRGPTEIQLASLNTNNHFEAVNMVNLAFRNHLLKDGRNALVKRGIYNLSSSGRDLGPGLMFDFGFYQSMRKGQAGWFQVTDISACVFYKPKSLLDFLKEETKSLRLDRALDEQTWKTVDDLLRDVPFVTTHNPDNAKVYRVLRVSKESAGQRKFTFQNEERTVADHFQKEYAPLRYPHLPCVLVGSLKNPIAFPLEVCKIPTGQAYSQVLPARLKKNFTQGTALKPDDRLRRIRDVVKRNHANYDPSFMKSFGIKIPKEPNSFVQVDEKILKERSVIYEGFYKNKPQLQPVAAFNGQWRMGNRKFLNISHMKNWAIVNMVANAYQNVDQNFKPQLVQVLRDLGILSQDPGTNPKMFNFSNKSIADAFKQLAPNRFELIMFVINEDDDSYQQIKQLGDKDYGIVTQCISFVKLRNQLTQESKLKKYCENVSLKINAKLGGKNQGVEMKILEKIKIDDKNEPVMFLGADVTHFGSGSGKKSIAAVVGSKDLGFHQYCGQMSEQENPKEHKDSQEIILDMEEMAHSLIASFVKNNRGIKPTRIIFYRDGVDSGQVQKVIDSEIQAIKKACGGLGFRILPKITTILVLKRHHCRIFPMNNQNESGNIPSGSYVDSVITNHERKEFLLCSHDSPLGTAKAADYQVIFDENGLSLNDVINLSFDLCHLYVSSTKAVSLPAPLYYAHLAAFHGRNYDDHGDNVSETEETDADGEEKELVRSRLIKINKNLEETMFFI